MNIKTLTLSFLALLESAALIMNAIAGTEDGITNYGGEGTLTAAIFPPEKTGEGVVSANSITAGPALVTFTVVNKHSEAISTSHAHQAGGPTAVSGGNVAINDAGYDANGDFAIIEANHGQTEWFKVAVVGVDVSYVDGFSLPISCSCNGVVVTGCNKNLSALGTCPYKDKYGKNACINPKRADRSAKSAAPLFAPCQGVAYTFQKDHDANNYGEFQIGHVSCCIGTDCPPA
ncbi:hypothetical protein VMCG_04225 [Cytospora schulzeri]|uniref:CHRD domain-containing protein n=1 Tax=Cytospora schulzeri TaxID=448051 RepID=A0A423WTE0_9PEZI|nr:hypothetical protein VMCG_04225 [Valsa malicola]